MRASMTPQLTERMKALKTKEILIMIRSKIR